MGDLAAEQRDQQQTDETDDQLIEQGQGHRRLRQLRSPNHHGGRAPCGTRQYAQSIAQQHAAIEIIPRHPAGKRDADPDKGQNDPQPLHRPQTLTGQQPVHAQRGKNRRGIEEHRHVRGRGQLQAFGNEEKLQAKQGAGQQPAAPRSTDLIPAALPADHQTHEQRGHARAPGRLHDRRNVGRRPFDHHLLDAPDQAQTQHHLQGKTIGATPGGAHLRTLTTAWNMATTRQWKQNSAL
ncbi:hypothetical protein D3C87_1487280 [compost metagenome]